jgi:DNA-binding FadR family transcriptional regulator
MQDEPRTGVLPAEVRRVADELLARVISGAYPAGLRFPSEPAIAGELGCGRSTVREALRHLAGLGVVQSRRGSGATVLDFRHEGTPALLTHYLRFGKFDQPAAVIARELLGLRSLLATEAVRLAARYARPEDLGPARALLGRAKALVGDPVAHAKAELAFFRAIVSASRVWPAVWLANSFWGPMNDLLDLLGTLVATVRPDHQARMTKLLALIETHDEARAHDHVRSWLADVDRTLIASIESALALAAHEPPEARSPEKNEKQPKARSSKKNEKTSKAHASPKNEKLPKTHASPKKRTAAARTARKGNVR